MRRTYRIVMVTATMLLIVVLSLAFRSLSSLGVFTSVPEATPAQCNRIGGIAGAQDAAIDRAAKLLFLAGSDGLYVMRLDQAGSPPVRMAGSPIGFHPHGISLYAAPDGTRTLMAIDHRGENQNAVDIFDVVKSGDGVALHARMSIDSSLLTSANGIAAIDASRFYVTNSIGSRTHMGVLLELFGGLPRSIVVYFDGVAFRTVVTGASFATGIAVSPDGSKLYVSELLGRRVDIFTREPIRGNLTKDSDVSVSAGPDKIDTDLNGDLWFAAHPKPLKLVSSGADPLAPSEVWHLAKNAQAANLVYANSGRPMPGIAAAVFANGHLYVVSPAADGILNCAETR